MESPEDLKSLTWLQTTYEEAFNVCDKIENQSLFDEYRSNGGRFTNNHLGRYLRKIFPSVTTKKSRSKVTKKVGVAYKGLKRKDMMPETHLNNFNDIVKFIPPHYFVCHSGNTRIHIGTFTGDSVNGVKLVKEVIFFENKEWQLEVGGKQIPLQDFGISTSFNLEQKSILTICEMVEKLQVCKGKSQKANFKGNGGSTYCVAEHWTVTGDENVKPSLNIRSTGCNRVLTFRSVVDICRKCQLNLIDNGKRKADSLYEDGGVRCEKDSERFVHLIEEYHKDMKTILLEAIPEAEENFLTLLLDQQRNLQSNPRQRRWDKKVLRLCLCIWCRSRRAYEDLRNSKFLILPSGRLLQYYKNSVDQTPGFNNNIFTWMRHEAMRRNLPPDGWSGGIIFDEMSIQDDLVCTKKNGETSLTGFVNLGLESSSLHTICSITNEIHLATHVLQFVFLGLTGFRFPIAHFQTLQAKTSDLYFLFWKAVNFLNMYGFQVCFSSMGGAQANRDFVKLFFPDISPIEARYSTANIWFPHQQNIICIMDYSHVIKRVRNNLSKSGNGAQYKRKLIHGTHDICWDHRIKAFQWVRATNAFPMHHRLTHDHFFLTQESKMRNKLAEEVLDKDMLHLMEVFQKNVGESGHFLNSTVELLKHPSILVSNFRDIRPIIDVGDIRLQENRQVIEWFQDWESSVLTGKDLTPTQKEKSLISSQTRQDLRSCIIGFDELCKQRLKVSSGSNIPGRINSDIIEHVFCQQRGLHNGANANPTYAQYSKTVKTITIGQTTVSRKSNTGGNGAEPLGFNVNRPVNQRKALKTLNNSN